MAIIEIMNVTKTFKFYYDKRHTLKEFFLTLGKKKSISKHVVVDNVSFNIEKGEVVGLLGQNGSGKSTLLKLITRIIYPDKGTITVKGKVSSLLELGAGFNPDMTGRENIYINASIYGLKRKEVNKLLPTIIGFSELEQFIDSPVRTYSSGMYMRLAFSVAINVHADVLLIDEILAVGDVNFQLKCYEKLETLKNEGVTIVIVTHDTNIVSKFCKTAYWIDHGIIVASGDAKEVVNQYLTAMEKSRSEEHVL